MVGCLAPDGSFRIGHRTEHVVVVLEDVGVDRAELDTEIMRMLPKLAKVVDAVPWNVQRDLRSDASQPVDGRGVLDLLERIAWDACLCEYLEASARVAKRP